MSFAHVDREALLGWRIHSALALGSALFKITSALLAVLLGTHRRNLSLLVHVVLHELVQFCGKEALNKFARGHVLKLGHYRLNQGLNHLWSLWVGRKLFGKVVHLACKNLVTRGQRALQHFALDHLLNEGNLAALHRIDQRPTRT